MVERIKLTPELVDSMEPPVKGERWIGDTVIKGFGLRLWRSASGGHMRYAIRVADKDGVIRRRTFPEYGEFNSRFWRVWAHRRLVEGAELSFPTYGEKLDAARRWADDEIRILRGRRRSIDIARKRELKKQRKRQKDEFLLRQQPFQSIAQRYFRQLRRLKRGELYVDRLEKVFFSVVPASFRRAEMKNLDVEDLAAALYGQTHRIGVLREVRGLISRILKHFEDRGIFFGAGSTGRSLRRRFNTEFQKYWSAESRVQTPSLLTWGEADFLAILDYLETRIDKWQQAYCIRVYFELGGALSRLKAARWSQVVNNWWYPVGPVQSKNWRRKAARLDEDTLYLLSKIKKLGEQDFEEQDYWFPSAYGRKERHIRSTEYIWNETLSELKLGFLPLSQVARAYRHKVKHAIFNPNDHLESLYLSEEDWADL